MTEFQRVPVTKPFVAGKGRPDLERLHEVVFSIDRVFDDLEDFPLLLEIRNNVAQYINSRPEGIENRVAIERIREVQPDLHGGSMLPHASASDCRRCIIQQAIDAITDPEED